MGKLIIWIGFIVVLSVMGYYTAQFITHHMPGVTKLEMADRVDAKTILAAWQHERTGTHNFLTTAKWLTEIDFLFIIFYVSFVVLLSNDRMQQEKNKGLNMLLRMNILAIFITGILDLIENGMVLYNITYWETGDPFIAIKWLTVAKFILAGWAVAILLICFIRKWFGVTG